MKRLLKYAIVIAVIVYGPLVYLRATTPLTPAEQAMPADAVLVFGALVRSGQISALHAERLDTAAQLLEDGKVETIVVSNAARAADIMQDYLLRADVQAHAIEIDPKAPATPDTCANELARENPRDVILLSQSFHLPRIALQCGNLGLTGQYVVATASTDAPNIGTLRKLWIRGWRHTREALLIWTEMLGLYRTLS